MGPQTTTLLIPPLPFPSPPLCLTLCRAVQVRDRLRPNNRKTDTPQRDVWIYVKFMTLKIKGSLHTVTNRHMICMSIIRTCTPFCLHTWLVVYLSVHSAAHTRAHTPARTHTHTESYCGTRTAAICDRLSRIRLFLCERQERAGLEHGCAGRCIRQNPGGGKRTESK